MLGIGMISSLIWERCVRSIPLILRMVDVAFLFISFTGDVAYVFRGGCACLFDCVCRMLICFD